MQQRTALVIEDDEIVLMYIRDILEEAGLRVVGTPSAREGIALARRERPDVVVADYYSPEMDGLGLLEALRSGSGTEHTPLLFISSDDHPAFLDKLKTAGANGYLMKPFLPQDLVRTTKQLLNEA